MLKQFVVTILLLLSVIALGANSLDAQSAYRFKVDVPFQFVLNGKTLPAGVYVINLSRDQLRRRRRREYVGPWLPSPVLTEADNQSQLDHPTLPEDSPGAHYDLMESLTLAFLLALEALTPAQRAVLLLRDVFDYSTTETAKALDMSEANIKVTLHRARRSMSSYEKNRVANFSKRVERVRDTLQRVLITARFW